jgi:hypothetical protein
MSATSRIDANGLAVFTFFRRDILAGAKTLFENGRQRACNSSPMHNDWRERFRKPLTHPQGSFSYKESQSSKLSIAGCLVQCEGVRGGSSVQKAHDPTLPRPGFEPWFGRVDLSSPRHVGHQNGPTSLIQARGKVVSSPALARHLEARLELHG